MHASWLHAKSYTLSKGKKSARMAVRDLPDGFVVERENQRGINFDWTEFHDDGSLWFRLEIPYPRSAGPGGPFRILGWSTPVDAETSLNYFLRMRHVSRLAEALVGPAVRIVPGAQPLERAGAGPTHPGIAARTVVPVCGSTWRRPTSAWCDCGAC